MKKVVGVLFLICIMIATISFAAYYDEAEATSEEDVQVISVDGTQTEIQPRNYTDDSIIYDDLYKLENDVTVTEIIDGNAYIMGESVKIDGATIYGNLYVLAEKIEIVDSDIGSSVYLLGKDVTFSGMTNDLYVLGEDVKIDENTSIWRNVRVAAENLDIDGYICRNIYASVKNLNVSENTIIEGTLNYSSENEGNIPENAQIANVQYTKNVIENVEDEAEQGINVWSYVYKLASALVKTLVISLIVVFFVRKFKLIERTENVVNDLLKSFGKGALVLVVTPIIAVLLMITVVGLVLGISLAVIYGVLLCIATSIAAIEIAYRILSRNKENEITNAKLVGSSVAVSGIIWLISLIPVIGSFVKMILVLIGLGIVFTLMFQKAQKVENV